MRISAVSARNNDLALLNVRSDCGFACIRCGATVYQYCTTGDGETPHDLFLLCPPCRDALCVMEGAESVLAKLRAGPVARQPGLDRRHLPFMNGESFLEVRIPPGTVMLKTVCPIRFCGEVVLVLSPPEISEGPVQIRLTLGRKGHVPETIVLSDEWRANEWRANERGENATNQWAFRQVGNRYFFWSTDGTSRLVLAFSNNRSVTIEELRTHNGGKMLEIDALGARIDGVPIELASTDSQVIGADL